MQAKRQYDEAVACFRQVLAHNKNCATAHSDLAGALKTRGDLEEADRLYQRADELEPDVPTNLFNRALVKEFQGKYDEVSEGCIRG